MNPYTRLGAAFLRDHPAAAARVLEDFPADSVAKFLAAASPVTAEHVIEHCTPAFAAGFLDSLEPAVAGRIFAQFLPDFQITLLRQLDRDRRAALLDRLQPDMAATIQRLLPYAEGTAGALMEAPLASVPEELTVRVALNRIKRIRRGMKFYVYVVNAKRQLVGVVTLHELINAHAASTLGEIMHRHVVSLSPAEPAQVVINSPYWQEFHALPVTDENSVLLGVIRQKSMRRLEERSVHAGAVSGGLDTFVAVGELFSLTAGHLLAALISAGTTQSQRDRRE